MENRLLQIRFPMVCSSYQKTCSCMGSSPWAIAPARSLHLPRLCATCRGISSSDPGICWTVYFSCILLYSSLNCCTVVSTLSCTCSPRGTTVLDEWLICAFQWICWSWLELAVCNKSSCDALTLAGGQMLTKAITALLRRTEKRENITKRPRVKTEAI